jgi:hypothetical protein
MSPLELLLFGALCYLFGLVSGAVLIPGSWTGATSPSAGMGDEHRAPAEYRWARQVSAVLLIAVVVVIVVLDVLEDDYEVNPPVLVPLLLTAAGLLSVDLPRVRH